MISDLKLYCAPLQGFTDSVWRNTHAEIFGGQIDKYYTPFMRVVNGVIPSRDIKDIIPENNTTHIQPQIIACKPDDAVRMALVIKKYGYHSVDVNFGCPHPPIALKKKGSGILRYPADCEALLKALSEIKGLSFTVKMRLGYDEPTQWRTILPLFDIISPKEIVVHPRIGKDLYRGEINFEQFLAFYQVCSYPLVYNGDLHNSEQILRLKDDCPKLTGVMVGRTLVSYPDIFETKHSTEKLRHFHDLLFERYSQKLLGGEQQLLMKMKTLWEMMLPNADKKSRKLIKKSSSIHSYQTAVNTLFSSIDLK